MTITTCDRCGKKLDNIIEQQEMYSLRFTGGYGSVFGDGSYIRIDFCQNCLKELIGPILEKMECSSSQEIEG